MKWTQVYFAGELQSIELVRNETDRLAPWVHVDFRLGIKIAAPEDILWTHCPKNWIVA